MAKRTNWSTNGIDYFKISTTIGKSIEGKPIRKYFYGKSKKEAEQKRDEYLKNISNGLNINFQEVEIKDFMKMWLFEVVKVRVANTTFALYESIYRNCLLTSSIACIKIYNAKPIVIQRAYNDLRKKGKTSNTISQFNVFLSSFFNYAKREGYILSNPCFGVSIPKDGKEVEKIIPFADDEIHLILNNSKGNLKFLFTLAFATGLRRGELLGLRLKDLELEANQINVNNTIKTVRIFDDNENYTRKSVMEAPKTKTSIRVVPLPSNIIQLFHTYIKMQKEKYLKNGLPFTLESFIFTDDVCRTYEGTNITHAWKRTLKKANVSYRKFHNTRHTYATKLFEQGVPLKTVQVLLGHANIKITADIYTHVIPKQKEDAVNKLNFIFENM